MGTPKLEPRALEDFGPPASVKHLETSVSVCSQSKGASYPMGIGSDGGQGKRRFQSTISVELTLLFFPPFSFDIKQAEWMKGRCRHN